MKKEFFRLFFVALTVLCPVSLWAAEDILIRAEDVRITYEDGAGFENAKGYHLYVRKKSRVESILLTESTKDPDGKVANYAYRTLEYNSVNGDEIRILDGKVLDSPGARYPLIDSTPEKDKEFGLAFHIYIPSEMNWGYAWSRNGTTKIGRGTFINIRTFTKKYADYDGDFADNPFMFDFAPVSDPPKPTEKKKIVLTDDYNAAAADSFKTIAEEAEGKMILSKGPSELCDDIISSFDIIKSRKTVDVVIALDATGSMKDDVAKLRADLLLKLEAELKKFGDVRLGLLLYRDYTDSYNLNGLPVKKFEFTDSLFTFEKNLNDFKIKGSEGGDIPVAEERDQENHPNRGRGAASRAARNKKILEELCHGRCAGQGHHPRHNHSPRQQVGQGTISHAREPAFHLQRRASNRVHHSRRVFSESVENFPDGILHAPEQTFVPVLSSDHAFFECVQHRKSG